MTPYYAHSGDPSDLSTWQPLREHLRAVAVLARQKAEAASPADGTLAAAAWEAGWLHDLGKYRDEFQRHIRGEPVQRERTYHKQAGAAKAAGGKNIPAAFAIAGHHGGLPDKVDLESLVKGENGRAVAAAVWPAAIADCPELVSLSLAPLSLKGLDADLFTRVLFSCLVDADWTDTGTHARQVKGLPPEPPPPAFDAAGWLGRVLAFIRTKATDCKDPHVAKVRDDVLQACLSRADAPPGLFSLTVPTGGGKTLSGLAFALKHAATHGLRRIIYVAPYLSILDQNVRVIRKALTGSADYSPAVFEHHSLAEPPGDEDANETEREAAARRAENWDSPVIVTTNVQFFESLFAHKPSRCRKLHNIARSVVILDECQTLPPDLFAPTCSMLKQVAEHLGSTMVLCTATQPAFNHPDLKDHERLPATEIIPPSLDLFARLRRVELVWPAGKDNVIDWLQVAERMLSETQSERPAALCVVNTRRAARDLFAELEKKAGDGVFHLSTSMCPAHRLQVLKRVRQLLDDRKPCYLVSTQLIEAGVDIDFPLVLREMGPLEAVIQAAGRCNREGLLNGPDGSPGGRVIVFRSTEGVLPPDRWYSAGRSVVETNFLAAGKLPQIDNPADICEYFTRLYRSGSLDEKLIQAHRQQFAFAEVARDYRLIEDDGVPVVVASWREREAEIADLLDQVRRHPARANFRKLTPFQVNLRRYELDKAGGSVVQVDRNLDLFAWYGGYDVSLGLDPKNADGLLSV